MSEYTILKESCKAILEREDITQETREAMKKDIKMYEALETLDHDTIIRMFDTGIYNEIVKAYCKKAMYICNVDEKIISAVMEELKHLFDTIEAADILH